MGMELGATLEELGAEPAKGPTTLERKRRMSQDLKAALEDAETVEEPVEEIEDLFGTPRNPPTASAATAAAGDDMMDLLGDFSGAPTPSEPFVASAPSNESDSLMDLLGDFGPSEPSNDNFEASTTFAPATENLDDLWGDMSAPAAAAPKDEVTPVVSSSPED